VPSATIDPDIMSGEPVFTGTRVPVRNLIDYLSTDHTLNDFLGGSRGSNAARQSRSSSGPAVEVPSNRIEDCLPKMPTLLKMLPHLAKRRATVI